MKNTIGIRHLLKFLCLYLLSTAFIFSQQDINEFEINKCGTYNPELKRKNVIKSIQNSRMLTAEEKKIRIEKILIGEVPLCDSLDRPVMPFQHSSPSGVFLIHYDTIGVDAVDPLDVNKNEIPDYIDSVAYYMDYAYKVEVEQQGYLSPYPDYGGGGSPQLDVYIEELNGEAYGFTFSTCEILPAKKFPRYISFFKLDNNYSPEDSVMIGDSIKLKMYSINSYDAIKILCVHEFHHAIQNMYGDPFPSVNSLHEWTSSWMEYRYFPELKSYMEYMRRLFRSFKETPFSRGIDGFTGYRWSIFGQYIYRKFGDTVMKRMWELIGSQIDGYGSLDSSFREQGTSLAQEWCKFLPWLFYTGSRAGKGESFDDAPEFPEIKFNNLDSIYKPTLMTITDSLASYEARGLRYYFKGGSTISDDTLDIIFTNTDTESARLQAGRYKKYNLTLASQKEEGTTPIEGTKYFWLLEAPQDYCSYNYSYPGDTTCSLDYVYPNPFHPFAEDILYIPAPVYVPLYANVRLEISTVELHQFYTGIHQVIVHDGCRVIEWSLIPPDISSGVYIYTINYNDIISIGKFAVIRK